MKCQKCEKPATFHITELTGGEVVALHFCAECAELYLKPQAAVTSTKTPKDLKQFITKQLKIGQTAEDLARLDQKACPMCGITFYEFRQAGRLGCPFDYTHFSTELTPLLINIHGETQHKGKRPKYGIQDTEEQTKLIRLRRELNAAIEREDYEEASRLRDEIRSIEGKSKS